MTWRKYRYLLSRYFTCKDWTHDTILNCKICGEDVEKVHARVHMGHRHVNILQKELSSREVIV